MSAIQDAAYRLAEQLPRFAHRAANATSGDEAYRARRALAEALVVFGEACAERVEPAPAKAPCRVRDCAFGCSDPPAPPVDIDPSDIAQQARRIALDAGWRPADAAPPPVDIRLTAEELDAAIECIEASGQLREIDRAALAKLRAARGTR